MGCCLFCFLLVQSLVSDPIWGYINMNIRYYYDKVEVYETKGGEHLLNKLSFHYLIICDCSCVSETC